MISVVMKGQRTVGDPSCATETVLGSFLLSGASRTGSLSAPQKVCWAGNSDVFLHDSKFFLFLSHPLVLPPLPSVSWVFLHCVHFYPLLCHSVGYQGQDFDWADYLKQCEAEAAPQHCFPTVS